MGCAPSWGSGGVEMTGGCDSTRTGVKVSQGGPHRGAFVLQEPAEQDFKSPPHPAAKGQERRPWRPDRSSVLGSEASEYATGHPQPQGPLPLSLQVFPVKGCVATEFCLRPCSPTHSGPWPNICSKDWGSPSPQPILIENPGCELRFLPLCCVAWGKSLSLSEPQLPLESNEGHVGAHEGFHSGLVISVPAPGVLWGLCAQDCPRGTPPHFHLVRSASPA